LGGRAFEEERGGDKCSLRKEAAKKIEAVLSAVEGKSWIVADLGFGRVYFCGR
jgi:hypothetical protein